MICERCGAKSIGSIGSMFSQDIICLDCKRLEEQDPGYEEARRVEGEAVRRGDYNFRGVGVPPELVTLSREARRVRETPNLDEGASLEDLPTREEWLRAGGPMREVT